YFTDVRDFVSPARVEQAAAEILRESQQGGSQPLTLDQARERVEIHTFDIVVLQRVGKAALEHLNHQPVTTALSVNGANERLARVRGTPREAEARKNLQAAEEGLNARLGQWFFTPAFQYTMFWFLLIGFAIKVPVFPFHTWLPDAHVEAPTPISMILAGVL